MILPLVLALAGVAAPPAPLAPTDFPVLLVREERAFEIWRISWVAGYGALTAGSLAFVPHVPREERVDLYVGAAASAIAILPLLLFSQPEHDPGDVACQQSPAACAEATWRRIAAFQRDCRSPLMHVINVVYNAGVGAVLGFGYGHWGAAALNFGVGTALGELQIFTQPYRAARWQERR